VVVGETVGEDVLGFIIFTKGNQLNTPGPLACNITLSLIQINVSLNANAMGGLSIIITSLVIVSLQPLVSVAINRTFFIPIAG